MGDLDVSGTADNCVRVCLTEEGITSCCNVSSYHLVESHRKQLQRANARKAADAYGIKKPQRPESLRL
jgi:predicted aminopeptidase